MFGRNLQKENQFKICDFYHRHKKIKKMVTETLTYNRLLLDDDEHSKVEDNLLWLLDMEGISADQRIEFGSQIFEIDKYYNPYTKIEPMFGKLCKIAEENKAQSKPLTKMAGKILDFLDK